MQQKSRRRAEKESAAARSTDHLFKVHHRDARELAEVVPPLSIDVTVTSPPYFDLKDYGSEKQIGFGQDYQTYLSDLKGVFEKVHIATKDHGSLWIVIDSFRRDQELLPLPFDLANTLKGVGWCLKDIIIWKKERTVPWVKPGATRNIFEYILVFAKNGNTHQYFPDRLREVEDLKHWWVKYPERYNPRGKSLEEIWTFDIPTQGSWGNGYIRHFCPLPEGLVQRIIELTTNPGDIVLDPFSGSGTVPAQALFMGRRYIGFELNKKYIAGFERYIAENESHKSAQYRHKRAQILTDAFEKRIVELRILKMGRLLLKAVAKKFPKLTVRLLAEKSNDTATEKFKVATARYVFLHSEPGDAEKILQELNTLVSRPPLSKFGVQAEIRLIQTMKPFNNALKRHHKLYAYTLTNTHKYKLAATSFEEIGISTPIISPICIELDETDYK